VLYAIKSENTIREETISQSPFGCLEAMTEDLKEFVEKGILTMAQAEEILLGAKIVTIAVSEIH
jgi:hypothetical protein